MRGYTFHKHVCSKIYDKRDDFDFDIVNFPFLDGDVPCRASYGEYISQLIRFTRVCNHVEDFNARKKCLTAKLLRHGYRYHKKVQVGKDQEKAQSEKRFPLQKPRWEKNKLTIRYLYHETYRKPNEQLFSQ